MRVAQRHVRQRAADRSCARIWQRVWRRGGRTPGVSQPIAAVEPTRSTHAKGSCFACCGASGTHMLPCNRRGDGYRWSVPCPVAGNMPATLQAHRVYDGRATPRQDALAACRRDWAMRALRCARAHTYVHVGTSRRACAPACMRQCSFLRAAGQQHGVCRGDRSRKPRKLLVNRVRHVRAHPSGRTPHA